MMRLSHHVTGVKPAIGAAGLVTGVVMLSGGISGEPGTAPQAPAAAASSQPPESGPVTSSGIVPGPGVFASQRRPTGLMAIVIIDRPGDDQGPKAIAAANIADAGTGAKTVVITDNGGDGPGPKAAVIPGGAPPL